MDKLNLVSLENIGESMAGVINNFKVSGAIEWLVTPKTLNLQY